MFRPEVVSVGLNVERIPEGHVALISGCITHTQVRLKTCTL